MCGDLIILKVACFLSFFEIFKDFHFFSFFHFWIFFKRLLCARALKEFTGRKRFNILRPLLYNYYSYYYYILSNIVPLIKYTILKKIKNLKKLNLKKIPKKYHCLRLFLFVISCYAKLTTCTTWLHLKPKLQLK